jgi:hypothetical protein
MQIAIRIFISSLLLSLFNISVYAALPQSSSFKIARIYTGQDNRSHFGEISIPLKLAEKIMLRSDEFPVKSLIIIKRQSFHMNPHTAPHRQYIFVLHGQLGLGVGKENRIFKSGDVILAEDTTGKGHSSYSVGKEPCITALVVIP